jgi:hypothetical protein
VNDKQQNYLGQMAMDETENMEWIEQTQTVGTSPRVIIVLGLWFILITPITIFSGVGTGIIVLAIFFSFIWLFAYWQPIFLVMRFISGNKQTSPVLKKHELKYYHYISLGIKSIILLFMYHTGIRILPEKGFENLLR